VNALKFLPVTNEEYLQLWRKDINDCNMASHAAQQTINDIFLRWSIPEMNSHLLIFTVKRRKKEYLVEMKTPSMKETIQAEHEKTAQLYAIASINNYHYINLFSKLSPFNSTDIGPGQLCSDQASSDEEEVQNNAPPEIIQETISKNDDKSGGSDLQVGETKSKQTPPPTSSLDQKNSSPTTALQLQWIRWNGTTWHGNI
jgi:hypothetical protein